MIIEGNYVSDYISYSQLKVFDEEGPQGLLKQKSKESKSILFGSLLDDYLFLDKESFNDKYEIIEEEILTGDLYVLAKLIRNRFAKEDIKLISRESAIQDTIINDLILPNKLFNRIKVRETFISKFNNPKFYDFVYKLYKDKIIVHVSDLIFAKKCKGILYENKRTSKYFDNTHENIYQSKIIFNYKNVNIKCLLDMIIIDHERKRIIPIDLKTGSPSIEEFRINFFKYKYYLQSSLYWLAINEFNKKHYNGKYKVEDFKFIYLCRHNPENPMIYKVGPKWIDAGIKGFTTSSGWKHKGINELINEVKWHLNTKLFKFSREFYEKREIYLDDSYININ